jgi:hypothetical protein
MDSRLRRFKLILDRFQGWGFYEKHCNYASSSIKDGESLGQQPNINTSKRTRSVTEVLPLFQHVLPPKLIKYKRTVWRFSSCRPFDRPGTLVRSMLPSCKHPSCDWAFRSDVGDLLLHQFGPHGVKCPSVIKALEMIDLVEVSVWHW